MISKNCSKCDNPLSDQGTCPACLFNLALSHNERQPASVGGPVDDLPSIEELNRQFPQLQITRLIGRGGMGAIYQARQTALDRDVALKLIARPVGVTTSFSERFEREAKALAKLSHPNIVTVYDFGQTVDGLPYLIMEYVDGINLREAMLAKSVGHEDALEIVSSICKALAFAHSKGVVHRDIKPENILLGEDGSLKVADFGIAKIIGDSESTPTLTASRQVLGTFHYLAPEQLESPNQVDHRVDLYALGVIFYELLTEQLPLGRFEPPSAFSNSIDRRIDAIVMKTLARKPTERFQQAAELDSVLFDLRTPPPLLPFANEARKGERVSVPFTCEALAGFAEIIGFCHVNSAEVRLEFRRRDAVFGGWTSKTRTIVVPRNQLIHAEFVPGVFSSKLILGANAISTFEQLPFSEAGKVTLKVKREDNEKGMQVADWLSGQPDWALSGGNAKRALALETPEEAIRWVVLACLLIFCSVINIGALVITHIILAENPFKNRSAIAVSATLLISPVFLMQLITGCVIFAGRPRSLAIATSIVSLLPLTPVWILGAPIAIWALSWLSARDNSKSRYGIGANVKSWGTTTMLYVREMRWSRTVAAANVVALLAVIGGVFAYSRGYYPRVIEYRVVAENADPIQLRAALERRLPAGAVVREVTSEQSMRRANPVLPATAEQAMEIANALSDVPFSHSNASKVRISTWACNSEQVVESLKIEQPVELVWLAATTQLKSPMVEAEAEVSSLPDQEVREVEPSDKKMGVAEALVVPEGIASEDHLSGTRVQLVDSALRILPSYVSQLQISPYQHSSQLGDIYFDMEFSSQGRAEFDRATNGDASIAGVGLVVNGVIYGIAGRETISSTGIRFNVANGPVSVQAIMAAIRGPELPSELELLQ